MTKRYVYGVYPTFYDAEQQGERLVQAGVPGEGIALVANDEAGKHNTHRFEYIPASEAQDDRNWWQRTFGSEEDLAMDVDFGEYKKSLDNNEVLLLLDSAYEAEALSVNAFPGQESLTAEAGALTEATGESRTPSTEDPATHTNTENIRLHEEELSVDTHRKEVGDVHISKQVIEETQTIEVPLEREELHIKHITPSPDGTADPDAFTEKEIIIPLSEETAEVTKETRVIGEVEIGKTSHTDTQEVQATTRHEELKVDEDPSLEVEEDR